MNIYEQRSRAHGFPLARAHDLLARTVRSGEPCVDATAGNGHDTLALARLSGPGGGVVAFDVQPEALESAHARLVEARKAGEALAGVQLLLAGHETMASHLPGEWRGRLAAVTFNLGFLPGSDKTVVTRPETSLQALETALDWLRTGGIISCVAYSGHPGGANEHQAVEAWMERAGRAHDLERYSRQGRTGAAVTLFALCRR